MMQEVDNVEYTGIWTDFSDRVLVMNNDVSGTSTSSLSFSFSWNPTVVDNRFSHGVRLVSFHNTDEWFHEFSGNAVGGRELIYIRRLDDAVIEGSNIGQVILVDSTIVVISRSTVSSTM
jgi:parallel beta-helix repeat protein